MNKIIIDSLSKLPDEDLVAFVNCTASDAAITFAECMMQEARVVYSFTRRCASRRRLSTGSEGIGTWKAPVGRIRGAGGSP